MKILAIFYFKIFCKNQGNFSDYMLTENFDHALTRYHDITFLMVQSVGKVIQVSTLLSQRDATKNLN